MSDSQANRDMRLNNIVEAINNHKNNMLMTLKQVKTNAKNEANTNGEENATFIYGKIMSDLSEYFAKEKERKEEEAEQFRKLHEYLQDLSSSLKTNEELSTYSEKELRNITNELKNVTRQIGEMN